MNQANTAYAPARWINLFGSAETFFEASHFPFSATFVAKDEIAFESRAISQSDARVTSRSTLKSAPKQSAKHPDFVGVHCDPIEFDGHEPDCYKVAVWVKPIQNGENAGSPFLSVALTKIARGA